jgi:hypothetical protein
MHRRPMGVGPFVWMCRRVLRSCRHTTGRLRWHLPVWVGRRNGRSHHRDRVAVCRTCRVCSSDGQVSVGRLLSAVCHADALCRVGSCAGEYTLTGVWVSETQTLALSPGAWLYNPCGYDMVGFSGTIDVVAGLRRFSGSVTGDPGCTTFSFMEMVPATTTGTFSLPVYVYIYLCVHISVKYIRRRFCIRIDV